MRNGVGWRSCSRAGTAAVVALGLTVAFATPSPATSMDGDAAADSERDVTVDTATLLVTGEMLIHPRVSRKAAEYGRADGVDYDFGPMFDEVRPLITTADLALCHLEVQLGVPGIEVAGFPRLAAPAEFAEALAGAGFDGCSTASNHANDQGDVGVGSTIAALDAAGVAHTGTAVDPTGARGVVYELDVLTLGQISYTFGIQAHRRANPWSINKIDSALILADARALKAQGADFVVASLHWGAEYRHQPTRSQRRLAEELMASDAVDVIVGHHAHVLQPVEFINGKPVLFGLGNFLSNQAPDCCGVASGDGVAMLLKLDNGGDRWRVSDIDFVPTWVHRRAGGYLVRPVAGFQEGDRAWKQLRASLDRTRANLTFAGEERGGLTVREGVEWLGGSYPSPDTGRFPI